LTNPERYAKRYAEQYEAGSFETILVGVRRRHVLEWLRRYEAQCVLEVGCALEPLFTHYDDFSLWRTVEPIAEFALRAHNLAAENSRVQVLEGYIEDQAAALANERFDFITVSGLLHEVPDPRRVLDAVHSVCNERTTVHFNVPNASSFHRLLAVEMGLIGDVSEPSEMDRRFGHRVRFDCAHFTELVEGAGFSIVESGTYFVKPFTHEQMDAIIRTGAFPPSLLDGLDRMVKYMPEHGCELYANVRKA
jgi:hypothetical protein